MLNELAEARKILAVIKDLPGVLIWEFVGSRITCDPAPTDTDCDVLVFTSDMPGIVAYLEGNRGWTDCKIEYEANGIEVHSDEPFCSYRQDELNLIITDDYSWFQRFMTATELCRMLNVMNKEHRIILFTVVRRGKQLYPTGKRVP